MTLVLVELENGSANEVSLETLAWPDRSGPRASAPS